MSCKHWPVFVAAAVLVLSGTASRAEDIASVEAATYGAYSVSAPSSDEVVVCHGFGCKFRTEVALTDADHAALARLLAAGKHSAAAERKAVAAAGAWFDRRIATAAGTKGHVARANRNYMFDSGQFDCIDTSRNGTSLLLLLAKLKLLHYHDVATPEARGYLIDGRPPHATAVLVERATGTKWSVDAWTRSYGRAPEIMPLEKWMSLD